MPRPSMDQVLQAAMSDDYIGFCNECGAEHYQIEPDARNYECEECGAMAVYGAEELLI